MAVQTLTRICGTYDEAVQYVYDLERAGLPNSAINIVGSDIDHRLPNAVLADDGEKPSHFGAILGAVIGGGLGALAGLGAVAVPGIGPLVAAGWFVSALSCAGVGALLGALIGNMIQASRGRSDASQVAAAVGDGQYVVLVRATGQQIPAVQRLLNQPLTAEAQDAVENPLAPVPGDPTTSAAGVSVVQPVRVRA